MDYPNLAQIFFIISILAFLLALILIVPTILEEKKSQKRIKKTGKNWHLPFHRFKRNLKKYLNPLINSKSPVGLLSTLNLF